MEQRNLHEREAEILKSLVHEFIITGKPVGSRSFVNKYSFSISPATMRNVMFDLEELGYLMQLHTSSGRVPTDKGYRFYVDSLLDSYEFVMTEKMRLREELLEREVQLDKMFASITRMLSLASTYAGIVLTPQSDFTVVKHIQLLPLDKNDIMFILVTRTGVVINKKVHISEDLSPDDLQRFSRYLTEELCGYSLFEIKADIFEQLRKKMVGEIDKDMALDIAQLALSSDHEQDIFVEGIENILHIPEMIEAERLKSFLHLIEEKKSLTRIMVNSLNLDGVNTLIGDEIPDSEVCGCSIITASYKIGTKNVGVVGIIGPTRMDYRRVVPLVDYTGKVVSELLTKMSK